MDIIFMDTNYTIDSNQMTVESFWNKVNDDLATKQRIISYILIDDVEVYNMIYETLEENWDSANKIYIEVISYEELVNDVLSSIIQYTTNGVPMVTELAESFYTRASGEDWMKLTDLFEALQWIINSTNEIQQLVDMTNNSIFTEYVEALSLIQNIIPEFLEGLENQDTVVIADLLTYEIIPNFEVMGMQLKRLTEMRG